MSKLMTTQEMLNSLSVTLRFASYSATDCSNHLAAHSKSNDAQVLYNIAIRLSELATAVRETATAHEK